jgi:glutaconate CoA-transferase subunit B
MRLVTVHPGVSVQQVVENTGFDLIVPKNVPTTEFPTCEELAVLRAIDPTEIYIPRPK